MRRLRPDLPPPLLALGQELLSMLDQPKLLAIGGPRGTGKTAMAAGLVTEYCALGRPAVYQTAAEYFGSLSGMPWDQKDAWRKRHQRPDLLVLDEVQVRDSDRSWQDNELTTLIDVRHRAGLSTLLVSNLTPAELKQRRRQHLAAAHRDRRPPDRGRLAEGTAVPGGAAGRRRRRRQGGRDVAVVPLGLMDGRRRDEDFNEATAGPGDGHAEAFYRLFEPTQQVQWKVAGSVRRRRSLVGDIEHVVRPAFADVPGDGLFAEPMRVNLLWRRLDELVAAGTVAKAWYGNAYRWGEKYRGVTFRGFTHELFTADADNWGSILAIRTGPAEFSQRLVTGLRRNGRRAELRAFPLARVLLRARPGDGGGAVGGEPSRGTLADLHAAWKAKLSSSQWKIVEQVMAQRTRRRSMSRTWPRRRVTR